MKIGYIRLKSYIGISNGLGLDEIYIDLTKATKNLILIHGDNGSGKSTILNALSPFPDDNSSFLPNRRAEKEMSVINGDIIYKIKIIHPINSKGERDTTKAYIYKIVKDEEINLNPNGNISSYKDILYTEFSLDPNYISLSKLSMDDKGLVDKTPSERKRFVNNVLDSLDVYNNIHKTLVKRSSIFKSMINNITSKIDHLGDEEKLKLTLNDLNVRIEKLTKRKDDIIEAIASNKTMIGVIDPDNSIQDTYNNIYSELNKLNEEKDILSNKIHSILSRLKLEDINEEDLFKLHKRVSDEISDLSVEIQIAESNINNQLSERESQYKTLEAKTEKLKALNNNINYDELKNNIKECKGKIKTYEGIFNKLNIDNPESISADEYLTAMDALHSIKESIDTFKSFYSYDVINDSVQIIRNGDVLDVSVIDDQIIGLKECIENDRQKLSYYEGLLEAADNIKLRPSKCKISDCPFIKEALEASSKKPEENISKLIQSIEDNQDILNSLISSRDKISTLSESCNQIRIIMRSIESYSRILSKFPVKNILLDQESLLNRLQNNNDFDEIRLLSEYNDLANIFEQYKYEKERLISLKNSLNVFESKMDMIGLIENEISDLNEKLNGLTELITEGSSKILENKKTLKSKNEFLIELDALTELYSGLSEIEKSSNLQKSEYSAIRDNMMKINTSIANITNLNGELDGLAVELNDLIKDRDTVNHSVSLLEEYKIELNKYKESYNKIETIKEYSSPNTGIQLLFIEIYMNKILSLSNELLSLLFEGRFVLQPFVINEKEFRIPCQGNGLLNDDISSMSASERSLISMIISFSLLFQASTKYNILCLDEIDSPLDSSNRLQFLNVLERQINILNIEQTFMISHNAELNYNDCSIILLKCKDGYISNDPSLNIIYQY